MSSNKNRGEWPSIKRYLYGMALVFTLFTAKGVSAQGKNMIVQIARLQIDSARLDEYKTMLKEGIETAIRVEPGVLTLYAVYEKEHPAHVTVFEVYADQAAYEAHIGSAHFQKYKTGTQSMIKSLELVRVSPIALGSKGN